ncbi:MAG: hypothetical protein WC389_10360 [Lutibacter sp.]|jgi:hypothetical protein
MHESYLIQRLKKPFEKEPENLLETILAYGLQVTGFNKEASNLLRQFCRFDYMGSAEFEFGAIPKVFGEMIKNRKTLIAKTLQVPYYYKNWDATTPSEGVKLVFYICQQEDEEEVVKRITHLAVGDPKYRTKERVELDKSLADYKYSKDIVGWLELDNGYMFFKDYSMFDSFRSLFGIKL